MLILFSSLPVDRKNEKKLKLVLKKRHEKGGLPYLLLYKLASREYKRRGIRAAQFEKKAAAISLERERRPASYYPLAVECSGRERELQGACISLRERNFIDVLQLYRTLRPRSDVTQFNSTLFFFRHHILY